MFFKILTIICFLSALGKVTGQEVHLSQFYSSPFTLNPALTGYYEGRIRAGLQYKNQWNSVTTPYETSLFYLDGKWHQKALESSNWFGIGGMVFNDRAGDGKLSTNRGLLGISLHKAFNQLHTTYMSIGFSGGLGQKSLQFGNLSYGNQWDGSTFDQNISDNENYTGNSFMYFDMNTGLIFSAQLFRKVNFFAGGALNHITKHNESFYGARYSKEMKGILHASAIIEYSPRLVIEPSIYYTKQRSAGELIIGSNFAFKVYKDALYAGIWYRISGDISPVIGFLYRDIRMMVSYDYNLSKLKPASNSKGGIEISLVYILGETKSARKSIIKCPAFYEFD